MSETYLTADITVLSDRNAAVAAVSLVSECTPVVSVLASSTGSAKREPGDVHDPEIALNLAAGRALENLGRKLKRRGEAQVRAASKAAEEKRAKDEERRAKKTESKADPWAEYLEDLRAAHLDNGLIFPSFFYGLG